ncbi:MAG: hypothetical protein H6Q75_781 [Firmicutes bacterium]|nr:hypothetical protein [Bacillota bacterium]
MSLSGVKCTVANCKYNNEKRLCSASAIEVNVDGGGESARASQQTNCHTFEAK